MEEPEIMRLLTRVMLVLIISPTIAIFTLIYVSKMLNILAPTCESVASTTSTLDRYYLTPKHLWY